MNRFLGQRSKEKGSRLSMILTAGIWLTLLRGFVDLVYFHSMTPASNETRFHQTENHDLPLEGKHQRLLATVHSDVDELWEKIAGPDGCLKGIILDHLKRRYPNSFIASELRRAESAATDLVRLQELDNKTSFKQVKQLTADNLQAQLSGSNASIPLLAASEKAGSNQTKVVLLNQPAVNFSRQEIPASNSATIKVAVQPAESRASMVGDPTASIPPIFREPNATLTTCQEFTFEMSTEFIGNDVLVGTRDSHEVNAVACCKRCETLQDCTHWSWYSDQRCSIRHGKLGRMKNLIRPDGIISGRVSLNSYVERVHNIDVLTTGDERQIQQIRTAAAAIARSSPGLECKFDKEDQQLLAFSHKRPASYIVINEARSGSSWLQEISQMHPGIKVQFELDLAKGDAALMCRECHRPKVPVSKYLSRLPPKAHPPQACGMTLFGSSNRFHEVAALAGRHNASVVILLRLNHVAHAISIHRHFNKMPPDGMVPWDARELARNVEESRHGYDRLVDFAGRSGRPVHLVFYEDMKRHPREVWAALQAFIGVAAVEVEGMEGLEKKSSNRPSVEYLRDLPGLRRQHAGADWARMLINPHYDEEEFDAYAAFAAACRRYPAARMSWRGASCPGEGSMVHR